MVILAVGEPQVHEPIEHQAAARLQRLQQGRGLFAVERERGHPQTRGSGRDAAIGPNKPDRFREEFSLFSLVLALFLIK